MLCHRVGVVKNFQCCTTDCFLQRDWQLQNCPPKTNNVNEAQGIGWMSPDLLLSGGIWARDYWFINPRFSGITFRIIITPRQNPGVVYIFPYLTAKYNITRNLPFPWVLFDNFPPYQFVYFYLWCCQPGRKLHLKLDFIISHRCTWLAEPQGTTHRQTCTHTHAHTSLSMHG